MVSNLTGPGVHPPGKAADPATNTSLDESDSNAVTVSGPDDIPLTLMFISDSSWPANFQLDINLNNWVEWSRHVSLLAGYQGFTKWLKGTIPQPSVATHAEGHHIWESNDYSLKCFLLAHISTNDYDSVHKLPTANAVFEALRRKHEQGVPQAVLILQALDIRCLSEGELSKCVDEVKKLHNRIVAMGPIDPDQLLIAFLLNMLNGKFQPLQSQLLGMIDDPSFSSNTILRRLSQEDNFFRYRQQQNPTASSALVAQGRNKPRPSRTHRKRTGH